MKRYRVEMTARIYWQVEAESPEAAETAAWGQYEQGCEPDCLDCSTAEVKVIELHEETLADLLRAPVDGER